MKHIKTYESILTKKYEVGDYILPFDKSRKNCYVIIKSISNGNWADYMVEDRDIFTDATLSYYPIKENEIERKLTDKEIKEIKMMKLSKNYNL